jgi:hypothetical protein
MREIIRIIMNEIAEEKRDEYNRYKNKKNRRNKWKKKRR